MNISCCFHDGIHFTLLKMIILRFVELRPICTQYVTNLIVEQLQVEYAVYTLNDVKDVQFFTRNVYTQCHQKLGHVYVYCFDAEQYSIPQSNI